MDLEKKENSKGKKEKKSSSFTRSSVGKPLTRKAGIFKIIGIAESNAPGGYSWRKHELD